MTTQTSFNVGINLQYFDQFLYLPRSYTYNDKHVNVLPISDYDIEYGFFRSSRDINTSPFDLMFHPAPYNAAISPAKGVVSLQIYSKVAQLHAFKRIEKSGKYPNFFVPEYASLIMSKDTTAMKRNLTNIADVINAPGDRLLVRADFGTQGNSLFPINKHGDMPHHLEAITKDGGVEWISNLLGGRGGDEGLERILSRGWHLVSAIDDIENEYRLLVEPNGNTTCCKRMRVKNEFNLPVGRVAYTTEGAKEQYKPFDEIEFPELKSYIAIVNELITDELLGTYLPFGSFDLFITKSGQFGFFEFSTQFALNGMQNHLREIVMMDIVDFYLDKL